MLGFSQGCCSEEEEIFSCDRLAAAGRLRTAVALELVAGKVWAPLNTPKASSCRCCAGMGPRSTRQGPRPPAAGQDLPRPLAKGAALVLIRLGSPSARMRSTPPCTRLEGRTRGLDTVTRDHPSSNLMPRAGRAGCSLNRLGRPAETKPSPAWGNPVGPVAGT